MADDTNTAEREAIIRAAVAAMPHTDPLVADDLLGGFTMHTEADDIVAIFQAGRASLAASAGSHEINRQLYTALNNLFTHLGMEGCITADHTFVWDAMTALKRIDGGVHLDNLAVPVDPDAHRDDMLAAVQLLEDGEWAEHFAKTPIGMRLEEQITKLHGEISAAPSGEPIPDCPVCGDNAKVSSISGMWHCENCHGNRAASAGGEPVAAGSIDNLKLMMEESAWGGQILLSDALANIADFATAHPSPPEGMAGWRQGVEAVAAMLTKKADDFAKEHGHDDMGGLSFGRGAHADAKLDYHSGLLELADEVREMREMRSEATPELSSGNRVLMEHSGCGRGTQIDTLTVRLNPGDKVILCPGPVTRASITAPPLPASEAKEL